MRRLIAILVLSLIATLPAHAAATRAPTASYDVEVVVFETLMPDLEAAELWTVGAPVPPPPDAVPAPPSPALDSWPVAAALQRDPRFRILVHKRWTQPADARSASKPVRLATDNRELDGTLRFYVSRFLHVELSLGFQPTQSGAIGTATGEPLLYQLAEERRIRSQDVNYFDHPKFGALVRVMPVGKQ